MLYSSGMGHYSSHAKLMRTRARLNPEKIFFIDALLGPILQKYLLRQVHAKTSSLRDLHYKVQIETDQLCSFGLLGTYQSIRSAVR